MEANFLTLSNPGVAALGNLPVVPLDELRRRVIINVNEEGWCVSSFFGVELGGRNLLICVLRDDSSSKLHLLGCEVGKSYKSLTAECAAFHLFERELRESTGIEPAGHPWLKPIRFNADESPDPGVTDYFALGGEGAHEVSVGPVYAGLNESGHFRFQCVGEYVHLLEISLGYQHRGIESMLVGGPTKKTLPIVETIAGDSSTSHAGAYCQLVEAMSGMQPSKYAQMIRGIAWEFERIANHAGDLGALAGNVAYLPTRSYCGRIRDDFLDMTACLCGNRFGRGLIVPGGVGYDVGKARAQELIARLDKVVPDLENALDLMFAEQSVLDRFKNLGAVSKETAREIGLVGMVARASGLSCDVRTHLSYGVYGEHPVEEVVLNGGDVLARARIRYDEIRQSLSSLYLLLSSLPEVSPCVSATRDISLPSDTIGVSLVESWRGEVCHVALTDGEGRFMKYKIVDPSFHNWFGLAMSMRDEQVSHFPLCNKSFNLSCCGHDL